MTPRSNRLQGPGCAPARRRSASRLQRNALPVAAAIPLLSALAFGAAGTANAHDAPSGWAYPYVCCSGHDCRPVSTRAVSERPEGYVIKATGEVVGYSDWRVRKSPDGEYHWCSVAGADDGKTICLFVPQNLF